MTTTYRLSSIVDRSDLPSFGPTGQPVRVLIRNTDDHEVCAIRSDAGPVAVGNLTAEQAVAKWADPMDNGEGDYYRDAMTALL